MVATSPPTPSALRRGTEPDPRAARGPGFLSRLRRHVRISWRARGKGDVPTPPFLILFINSICNLTCDHCFYWRNLNQRDDLTFDEMRRLSEELGPVENLNLSGGEPFIRPDFAEVVKLFIGNNGVRQIYVPTSGYFTDRTEKALRSVLQESSLDLFVCELSLDGMEEYHNRFRGNAESFQRAMKTYDMLAAMQKDDARLRIHCISTATSENTEQIRGLTDFLLERCPAMDHHNLALIRGERKDPSLKGPALDGYKKLWEYLRWRWQSRESGRFGSTVEPLLQWTKERTAREERQIVPCRAGVLSAVVYANGDVSFCETHAPLGNLRKNSFREIWTSNAATALRNNIAARQCWCTNEVFMWPSIVFQPAALARACLAARPWRNPTHPGSSDARPRS